MRALLLSISRRTDIPEADMPPWKKACLTTPAPKFEIRESSAAGATREAMYSREAWAFFMDRSSAIAAHVRTLKIQVAALITQTTSLQTQLTMALGRIKKMAPKKRTTRATPATATTATTTITNAQLQALIDRGVVAALAERDADRSKNGTEGVIGLTRWLEKIESVFQISNCTVACQVKFASCTLQGSALTWWNSHMRAVGQDVAYAMPWADLKRMITYKYCPRGEIQKLESEYWNLKVKGVDLLNYNHRFQELALMCDRMFPEESAKVERYIGGLPDMIHGSVKASKSQSMQEAIEFATEMMDKKMLTHAERQAEHKRKFDDTSRSTQHQQQPPKRNNVARAYTAGQGDRKHYRGTKTLCPKCNYHHDRPCAPSVPTVRRWVIWPVIVKADLLLPTTTTTTTTRTTTTTIIRRPKGQL
uniref:Reverse transcriptase domain-containing protein n=1 Tax=Tanacetum cinerariifolium TaxID=118510 RepID=A0A699K964_TANCI|nr:reverse transcriptase domain-containing protein [Tanacetum cinerariifolium]